MAIPLLRPLNIPRVGRRFETNEDGVSVVDLTTGLETARYGEGAGYDAGFRPSGDAGKTDRLRRSCYKPGLRE